MKTYLLKARQPVRAYALTAVLAVLGAGTVVAALDWKWPTAVQVIGWVLLGLALALVVTAALAVRRMRVTIELDDDGYAILGPNGERTGDWKDITKVTQSAGGSRLTFHHGPERRTILIHPGGGGDPEFARLAHDISGFMDRSRGYRSA